MSYSNIVTIAAQSIRLCVLTCAMMPRPSVNCILNDGLASAMPNMQQMLLQFTTLVYTKSSAIYKENLTGTRN